MPMFPRLYDKQKPTYCKQLYLLLLQFFSTCSVIVDICCFSVAVCTAVEQLPLNWFYIRMPFFFLSKSVFWTHIGMTLVDFLSVGIHRIGSRIAVVVLPKHHLQEVFLDSCEIG